MAETQGAKNTTIQINGTEYTSIISSSRSEISTSGVEKFYNYKGDPLATSGGAIEYGDITVLFAEFEYDRLRDDLSGVAIDGVYPQDMSIYPFTMTIDIAPLSGELYTHKFITYNNCRIIGKSDTEVVKDSIYYTTSVTISVESVEEKRLN